VTAAGLKEDHESTRGDNSACLSFWDKSLSNIRIYKIPNTSRKYFRPERNFDVIFFSYDFGRVTLPCGQCEIFKMHEGRIVKAFLPCPLERVEANVG